MSLVLFPNFSAVSYDEFKKATEAELVPARVHEGTLGEYEFLGVDDARWLTLTSLPSTAFMFETGMQVTLTDYAMKRTGKLHGTLTRVS